MDDGVGHGPSKTWWETKHPRLEAELYRGQRHGTWTHYDRQGAKLRVETYDRDNLTRLVIHRAGKPWISW